MASSTSVTKISNYVEPELTLKACKALLAHIKKTAAKSDGANKKSLYGEDISQTPIMLNVTTKNHIHPDNCLKPGKIVLPHPLRNDTDEPSTICLIVADPQRFYKDLVAGEEFPDLLRKRITRVIDLTHLKAKFKAFEAQRQLSRDHDIFLADDRVINQLPKALGKSFYKTTAKRPVPVVLMARRSKEAKLPPKAFAAKKRRDPKLEARARPAAEMVMEIEAAAGAARVHLPHSNVTSIIIGFAAWKPKHLAANTERVVDELVARFIPKKWSNVRSLFIKGPQTASLPIYQTNELWVDDSKIVADEESAPATLPWMKAAKRCVAAAVERNSGEKANIGKKRKSSDAEPPSKLGQENDEHVGGGKEQMPKKKAKKQQHESSDDKLDKAIAERKAKLKKQKISARKAVDV